MTIQQIVTEAVGREWTAEDRDKVVTQVERIEQIVNALVPVTIEAERRAA